MKSRWLWLILVVVWLLGEGLAPMRSYLWKGHRDDLQRYWMYANQVVGGPVDPAKFREWNGDLSGLPAELPGLQSTQGGGKWPYQDFAMEYPPGNLPPLLAPRLLTPDLAGYRHLFGLQMLGCLALACGLWRGRPGSGWLSAWAIVALGPLALSRLDAVVALALAAALVAALKARPWMCGLCLGWAAAIKLTPLLMLPLFWLHFSPRPRQQQACLAGLAVALLLAFGPWLGAPHLGVVFRYHALRPIEVESLLATPLLVYKLAGGPVDIVQSFGSRCPRLISGHDAFWQQLAPLWPWLAWALVMALCWQSRQRGAWSPQRLPLYLVATQLGLLVSLKVLSPQYLVTLIPLVFVLGDGWCNALALATCALTQLVFPHSWNALVQGKTLAILLLFGRNALLLCLWLRTLWLIRAGPPAAPPHHSAEANPA